MLPLPFIHLLLLVRLGLRCPGLFRSYSSPPTRCEHFVPPQAESSVRLYTWGDYNTDRSFCFGAPIHANVSARPVASVCFFSCSHLYTSPTTSLSAITRRLLVLCHRYSQYKRSRPNTRINWLSQLYPSRSTLNRRSQLAPNRLRHLIWGYSLNPNPYPRAHNTLECTFHPNDAFWFLDPLTVISPETDEEKPTCSPNPPLGSPDSQRAPSNSVKSMAAVLDNGPGEEAGSSSSDARPQAGGGNVPPMR